MSVATHSSSGLMRANTFSVAPTMTDSVPSAAAWRVRATGASANWMPRARSARSGRAPGCTGVVERSTTRPPGFRCVSRLPAPRQTAFTCEPPGSDRKTMSACSATSRDRLGRRHAGLVHLRERLQIAVEGAHLLARLGREVAAHRRAHHAQADKAQHHSSFSTASASTATHALRLHDHRIRLGLAHRPPGSSASRDIAATARASAARSPCGRPR